MYRNEKRTYIACITCKNHWFCLLNMQICGVLVPARFHQGVIKSYDGCCNDNRLKQSLGWVKSFAIIPCWTLFTKKSQVHFRLLGTNGFHVKAENERFSAVGLRCYWNPKYENFTPSFDGLRQKIALKSVPIIFPHSINQIIDLWRSRSLSSFLKLSIMEAP